MQESRRIPRNRFLLGFNVLLAVSLIVIFYSQTRLGQSPQSAGEVTLPLLNHYLPRDWSADKTGSVFFIHRGGIDSTSVYHLGSAIQFDHCGIEPVKVVFLLRPEQDFGRLPLEENRHWLQLVRVSEDDQSTLCTQCGFTAYVNHSTQIWDYLNMHVDPYALCDWMKSSQLTQQKNNMR
jgi:hypothetical protein